MMARFFESNNKVLVRNFFALFSIQILNYLIPLATTPYLTRVLGKEYYGINEYIVSLIGYFVVLIDFGFNISATKIVSENRANPERLNKIVSGVILIKLILFLVSVLSLLILVFLFPQLNDLKELVFFSFGTLLGQSLFPVWYFQGIEKIRNVAIVNIISRSLFAIAVFFFITKDTDYVYLPLLNSLGMMLSAILALYMMLNNGIVAQMPDKKTVFILFRESLAFFYSRASITIYTNTNALLLGSFISFKELALYNLAFKVVAICRTPFEMLTTVVYPNVVSSKNMGLVKRILIGVASASIIVYLIIFFWAELILWIIGGKEFVSADNVLRILCLILPLGAIHGILGSCVLVVQNKSTYFNFSTILASVCYLIFVGLLFLCGNVTLINMTWIVVLVDVVILTYRSYYIRKFKLLSL